MDTGNPKDFKPLGDKKNDVAIAIGLFIIAFCLLCLLLPDYHGKILIASICFLLIAPIIAVFLYQVFDKRRDRILYNQKTKCFKINNEYIFIDDIDELNIDGDIFNLRMKNNALCTFKIDSILNRSKLALLLADAGLNAYWHDYECKEKEKQQNHEIRQKRIKELREKFDNK